MTDSPDDTPDVACERQRALQLALAAIAIASTTGHPWALAEAHGSAGHCYRRLDSPAAAVAMLDEALRWSAASGSIDQGVDLMCELAEALAEHAAQQDAQGSGAGEAARARARRKVREAAQRAAHVADPRWEISVLIRLADVLDGFGEHDDAVQLQTQALRLTFGKRRYESALLSTPPRARSTPPTRH